jgi:hypothetical protein
VIASAAVLIAPVAIAPAAPEGDKAEHMTGNRCQTAQSATDENQSKTFD